MKLIDGKLIAEEIKGEIRRKTAEIDEKTGKVPHLAAILAGEDPASLTYIKNKEKACKECGIISSVYKFSEQVTEKQIMDTIDFINHDEEINGLIVQLPLPSQINSLQVIEKINPAKDVDGFHPINLGRMLIGEEAMLPATPAGILELIRRYQIETEGKHCVVLGRSNIVGTPVSVLMGRKSYPGNATVTLCHSKTNNLKDIVLQADILIAAIGQPEFVTADMVKDGAVVIDVGIHRIPADNKNGFRLIGDVKFDEVAPKCSYITPVPGGVGPMTIVSLLMNTMKSFEKSLQT